MEARVAEIDERLVGGGLDMEASMEWFWTRFQDKLVGVWILS